jgi:hypothetical protein
MPVNPLQYRKPLYVQKVLPSPMMKKQMADEKFDVRAFYFVNKLYLMNK